MGKKEGINVHTSWNFSSLTHTAHSDARRRLEFIAYWKSVSKRHISNNMLAFSSFFRVCSECWVKANTESIRRRSESEWVKKNYEQNTLLLYEMPLGCDVMCFLSHFSALLVLSFFFPSARLLFQGLGSESTHDKSREISWINNLACFTHARMHSHRFFGRL